jgi:hypothetical protein
MTSDPFDQALANMLAPPGAAPDRLFAAQVDRSIDDMARLRAAERQYARGFARELAALAAVLAGALLFAHAAQPAALDGWMPLLPILPLLLILLGNGRQASSPAPSYFSSR